jgi:hypothetical protein
MWRYIGWPTALLLALAEAIVVVSAWYSGYTMASYESSKRESELASTAARELVDAHEQNVRLNMQMIELTKLIQDVKYGRVR